MSSSPTQIVISDTQTAPESLIALLTSHLPHSLPVLRRIQFAAKFPRGSSAGTHILYAHSARQDPKDDDDDDDNQSFAAAYVDLSRRQETQVWIYSTLEDSSCLASEDPSGSVSFDDLSPAELELSDGILSALLGRIRTIAEEEEEEEEENEVEGKGVSGSSDGARSSWVLFGSVHEAVRQRMLRSLGVRMKKAATVGPELEWEFCGKWLFRIEDLVLSSSSENEEGVVVVVKQNSAHGEMKLRWDKVKKEDVKLVQSRTGILRTEETLLKIPSSILRLEDGTPVAWAFLGLDGTLMTLHVEEPYRRMGLAKAVARRVMRDHLAEYGDDGWGAADVFVQNEKSQALCRSIGGKMKWTLSWAVIDISSIGDAM